jgi:SAM-dependent methyltransferase
VSMLHWLLDKPAFYRAWQQPFVSQKFAPAAKYVHRHETRRVLDVGCGPGTNAAYFESSDYVGLDINDRYLAVARSRHRGSFIQADLTTADISSLGRFDTILINSFLHHLPDDAVHRVLSQTTKLLDDDGRIHVLELVLPARLSMSRLMARLDRGRYARPLEGWRTILTAHYEPVVVEPYSFGYGLWAMVYFQGRAR